MFGHAPQEFRGHNYGEWTRHWAVRYGCAVAAVTAATLLHPVLEKSSAGIPSYVTFYFAIMFAAAGGGFWPGILATLLSIAAADYFFISPGQFWPWGTGQAVAMAVFTSLGAFTSVLGEVVRRRGKRLRESEERLAENSLRMSEERYRSVVTAMAEGVVVQDASGAIVACNPRAEQILGLTAAEMQGRSSVDPRWRTIHEDGSPFPGESHPSMVTLRTGEPQEHVCMGVQKPDGAVSWILINSQPIFHGGSRTAEAVVTTFTDITEKRRTEEAVRVSEERFRVALQNSPIVVFNQDQDLRYTWINSPVAAWREKGWLGKTDAEIVENAEDAARLTAIKRGILESGRSVREEIPVHFQGRTTYYDLTGEPLRDRTGHVVGITCAVLDITERKQAEEARNQAEGRLIESQRKLLLHVQQTPLGVIEWDTHFRVVAWNPGAERILGYSRSEAEGQHASFIVPQDQRSQVDRVWTELMAQKGGRRSSNDNLTKDGRRIICEWYNTPLVDDTGSVIGVASLVEDVTEREQAEEQLRRVSWYARSLIEASLDPLVTISRGGKITDVNRATELATGVARDRLIGSDFSDYFTEPEKAREGYRQVFAKESVRDYPLAIRHTTGHITHVLYNASVFRNEAGEVEGVFAAARDISERKILEEQLLQAQKLEAVGRLAGGVAHDFNNIMGIILGYSELIRGKLTADDPSAKQLDNILKAAERAAGLTRQLLAFSRKQVMDIRMLNLNERIIELSKMLPRLIGESIELVLNLSADLGRVKADPVQFEQVLMNLAVNARDAMPRGGTLTIVSANADLDNKYQWLHPEVVPGPYVMISVSDTGVGMDEETRSHIFEPFFTTKGTGKGTGLGLSIIYGIVRQSGGHIWVYSEPGRGTTFKIYLPRVFAPAERAAPEAHPVPVAEPASGTILVVEDERALAEMTQAVLQDSGYTVLLAGSGEEAVRVARAQTGPIDLLLTDVILSAGVNGIELAARLRMLRPEIKVIYMSGYSDVLVKAKADVGAGAVLLEKPFTADLLRAMVRKALLRAMGVSGASHL